MKQQSRRDFLAFLGRTALLMGAGSLLGSSLTGCGDNKSQQPQPQPTPDKKKFPFKALKASLEDKLELSEGLQYDVLIRWDDPISATDFFGFNNDYLAFVPLDANNPNDGLLWVNHEYLHPLFVSGYAEDTNDNKTKEQVEKEMYSVGGSILRVRKNAQGEWEVVKNDPYNRRFTAKTVIPFHWDEPIMGKTEAVGTFAGCAGGVTPWGTVLSCEENYDMYYGETVHLPKGKAQRRPSIESGGYTWEKYYDYPPEHYGWVVEVDVKTGNAKKLVALGRCAHECATVFRCPDGRVVVYSGDDANDEHLYKFVSSKPNDLKEGTLYVANTEKGEWLPLVYKDNPLLQQHFKSQTEVLIRLREAAKILGATPLNRPEDIEIDPLTGNVLVALTNNKPKGDLLGQILKIEEGSADKTGTSFKASTFLAGGEATGFACPDNMAFDAKGNLWFTSDMSGSAIGGADYAPYGNNSLFLVPSEGEHAGEVIRVANAPTDAEFTGPFFAPDKESLFLSVQHPGELTQDIKSPTSHFPDGGDNIPRPCVVVISGNALKEWLG